MVIWWFQGGLSLEWYDGFRMVSQQGVMVSGCDGGLSTGWSQGGLLSGWSHHGLSVVFYQGGLSSWWSRSRVVAIMMVLGWSFIGVVSHHGGLSTGWSATIMVPAWSLLRGSSVFTIFHLSPCCSSVFHLDVVVNVRAFCRCSPSHLPAQFSLRGSNHGTGTSNAWSSTVSASTQRLLTPIGLACTG